MLRRRNQNVTTPDLYVIVGMDPDGDMPETDVASVVGPFTSDEAIAALKILRIEVPGYTWVRHGVVSKEEFTQAYSLNREYDDEPSDEFEYDLD